MKLLAMFLAAAAAQPQQVVAITETTVLPMTGKERLSDQTVLVSGDRITAVGPSNRIKVPAGARTIDGRGKVVMPGLVDMHIHLAPVPGEAGDAAQRALAVMLAHGVTTARTMAGSPQNLIVRGKVETGALAGPRIYAAAPVLHEKNTPGIEQARSAVQKAKAAGFDLIKAHQLPDPAVWQAVQDEARLVRMPVAGHVANSVGLDRALAAGQQVEHLDSVPFALLPDQAPEKKLEFGQIPPPVVAAAITDASLAQLASKVAAAKSWHVPTLSLFEGILDVSTPTSALAAQSHMRFVPPAAARQWSEQRDSMVKSGEITADGGRQIIDLRRRIARAFHRAGVPLMPGSDTAQAFVVWGPGLHAEIKALAAAGLSPMEALRSATVVPRDYFRSLPNRGSALGWRPDFGSIEPGARADLILLNSDPSRNLSALDRPQLVIAAGNVHDRAALDAMLEKAAADANRVPQAAQLGLAHPVYVIRHLQKASGDDPPLTAEGAANARLLARNLGGRGIRAVFATATRRAQETAAPLAASTGVPVATYDPDKVNELAKVVAAIGGPVLIVGHSNTVPGLVESFGGERPPAIPDDQYGTIYLVEPKKSQVHRLALAAGERG